MNEMMKIENIQSNAEPLGLALEKNFIYVQIDAKAWKYALFAGLAALSIQHFVAFFASDRIVLIGVTAMGDFSNKNIEILRNDIKQIQYKKGMIQGHITIETGTEKCILNVSKVLLMAPWHKENLEHLIQTDFR